MYGLVTMSAAKPAVYVVDDDPDVLGSVRFLLETDGFDVRTFRTGAAMLRALTPADVDCFVIDYKMPDMNGVDLTSRLRNRDIAAPVILITGHTDPRLKQRAREAGVAAYLEKPVRKEVLIDAVERVVNMAG